MRDVKRWRDVGLQTNYYASQAILGHGTFGKYLKEIKKQQNDECWYGCGVQDSPEHTVFACARFERERREAESALDARWERGTIGGIIVESEARGKIIIATLTKIMMAKEREEFRREEMG